MILLVDGLVVKNCNLTWKLYSFKGAEETKTVNIAWENPTSFPKFEYFQYKRLHFQKNAPKFFNYLNVYVVTRIENEPTRTLACSGSARAL